MTKPNSALIVVLLDRSGSMETCRGATIEGFNKFVYEQKQLPGEARMSLIQFDTEYETHYHMARLEDIHLEFVPRGGTALLDSMARAISETGAHLKERNERNRPDKVIFVTITDGQENSSRLYTRATVFDMITHQRKKYNWEFLFLGANQDAIATASYIGIPATHAMSYDPSYIGTQSTYGAVSNSVGRSRAGGQSVISNADRLEHNTKTGTSTAVPVPGADVNESK